MEINNKKSALPEFFMCSYLYINNQNKEFEKSLKI